MAYTINEMRKMINSKVEPVLNQHGFKFVKKYNTFIRNKSNEEEFWIRITPMHSGYFHMQLLLSVFNENIGTLRESIYELMLPIDRSLFSKAMKVKMKRLNSYLADLTDWRNLDTKHELHIWFESFKDINDISDFDIQFAKSVELGLSWFQSCEDFHYVIQYDLDIGMKRPIETAFLLLYYQNDLEKLDLAYEKVISNRKRCKLDVSHIEEFYHALKEYITKNKA